MGVRPSAWLHVVLHLLCTDTCILHPWIHCRSNNTSTAAVFSSHSFMKGTATLVLTQRHFRFPLQVHKTLEAFQCRSHIMLHAFNLAVSRLSISAGASRQSTYPTAAVALSRRGLHALFRILAIKSPAIDLGPEIWDCVFEYVTYPPSSPLLQMSTANHSDSDCARNPATPPADRSQMPILRLPNEVLRKIFAASLPAKDSVIRPHCGPAPIKAADRKPRRNSVSDLMTVCKRFEHTVKLAVYEERYFEVHVHQGGTGGVELLDAGYQPLAYMESGGDDRFDKFTGVDHGYGFQAMKKVVISIFPPTDGKRSKAVSLNTYFMIQALCRLLERGGRDKDRLVNVTIIFQEQKGHMAGSGRRNIMSNEHYWWDPSTNMPRTSSLHGLPDIELVLHPLARLTRVHNVSILLPTEIKNHSPTKAFVERLTAGMKSMSSLPELLLSEEQEMSIQAMRPEVEQYIYGGRFGRRQETVQKLDADDMKPEETGDDEFGEDPDKASEHGDPSEAQEASLRA